MTNPFGKPLDLLTVTELEALVRYHDRLYWEQDAPAISDYDYDRLVRRLTELAPASPVLTRVSGQAPDQDDSARARIGAKVEHLAPMLSLDKCYDEAALLAWALGPPGEDKPAFKGAVLGSPKIDGMAMELRYDQGGSLALAVTRGDGVRGDDVTANLREIPGVPRRIPGRQVEVRGEVYAPLTEFQKVEGHFANPRNFAAGTVKQKEGNRGNLKRLRFFAYDLKGSPAATESEKRALLESWGFDLVWGEVMPPADMPAFAARVLAARGDLDYELDGVVFRADRVAEQERLGVTAHHPRAAIAYKFQGESGVSTLERVEWSVARTGTITPVAIIAPVRLSGATVTRCSLHNLSILEKLGQDHGGLRIGDTVVAMRRGGVIPNLEASLGGGTEPVTPPPHCPSCGRETVEREGFLYCSEPAACRASSLGRLEHFAKVVELDGFGERVVDLLREQELLVTPADYYRLLVEDLVGLERMGNTLAVKLVARIHDRRALPLSVLLQSLGIREVGRQVAQAIARHVGTLPHLRAATADEIGAIKGVGPVIAANVVQGLADQAELIDDLLTFVTVLDEDVAPAGGLLAGKKVVFTGKLATMDRKEAQDLVARHGGETPGQVTKDLDYLVVGDEGSPLFGQGTKGSKLKAAERWNSEGYALRILPESEFFAMLLRDLERTPTESHPNAPESSKATTHAGDDPQPGPGSSDSTATATRKPEQTKLF